MTEIAPVPEHKVIVDPYERLTLDLLNNIKQDWTASQVIDWVTARLLRIGMDRESQEVTAAHMAAVAMRTPLDVNSDYFGDAE